MSDERIEAVELISVISNSEAIEKLFENLKIKFLVECSNITKIRKLDFT